MHGRAYWRAELARDNADHAGMPILAIDHQSRSVALGFLDHTLGFERHLTLNLLAFAVEGVEGGRRR